MWKEILFLLSTFVLSSWILLLLLVKKSKRQGGISTLIVLGSGGHTGEMISTLDKMDPKKYSPRYYVFAETDLGANSSKEKATAFEKRKNSSENDYVLESIYRSREVGQSYLTSIFTSLRAIMQAFVIIGKIQPDMILCNGPGTCIPLCFATFVLRKLLLKNMRIEFMESFACVTHLSLSGKLLYHLMADHCYVHWKSLQSKYPKSQYIGIESTKTSPLPDFTNNGPSPRWVFVTVGSTKFDAFIQALDRPFIIDLLQQKGFTGIRLQIGRGAIHPQNIEKYCEKVKFQFEYFDLKASLEQDISQASLILCHGGAGSLTEALRAKKRIIGVPNPLLMNNHQFQLVDGLAKANYLRFASLETIKDDKLFTKTLEAVLTESILSFPEQSTSLEEVLKQL